MTAEENAISKVMSAFNAFWDAYDLYVHIVDTSLPSDVGSEALRERIASLVIGSGDVGLYLRDYSYTVESLVSLARR